MRLCKTWNKVQDLHKKKRELKNNLNYCQEGYISLFVSVIRLTSHSKYFDNNGHLVELVNSACSFKGCGMGTRFVLVSPCFRENVVVTCKIGSFLCSLDNLLQKNVIVFFFGNQISKWRSFEKGAIFDLLFTFFSHQGSYKNSFSTYLTHIHTRILLTLWLVCLTKFWKKYEFFRYGFSLVWVLRLILIRAILEQSINNKMVSKN